jgi:hypothetical protein
MVEFEDPARDVVEEVAIVGHRHDGAGVVLQGALEPRDRLGVEVVGRFVEQEQIGFGEEQASQRATRRISPPDRLSTFQSPGGVRRASIAISTCVAGPRRRLRRSWIRDRPAWRRAFS